MLETMTKQSALRFYSVINDGKFNNGSSSRLTKFTWL
jgi:hypothetical protein